MSLHVRDTAPLGVGPARAPARSPTPAFSSPLHDGTVGPPRAETLGPAFAGLPLLPSRWSVPSTRDGVVQRRLDPEARQDFLAAERFGAQRPALLGQEANRTGLPDGLKAGIERRSGVPLDDVRVHYDSPNPARIDALAYTQGTSIHVAPGQEAHLAHEAWHVVQQKQGRVQGTHQVAGLSLNEAPALEREADTLAQGTLSSGGESSRPLAPQGGLDAGATASAGAPVQPMREFSRKDMEGFGATYDTILQGLEAHHLDPKKTLVVSVGRSPQVLAKYLERRGMAVIYLPVSGLSGTKMADYGKLEAAARQNRDDYFARYLKGPLAGRTSILTVDVGVSGSSNFEIYKEIKAWLARSAIDGVEVRMATISPFQKQDQKGLDTSAVRHEDNIFVKAPLDTRLRGIHRLLKVQYNSIDKDLAFMGSFKFDGIDKGLKPPDIDKAKEAEVGKLLDSAALKYGPAPAPQRRRHPDKPFSAKLLYQHEVDAWQKKQKGQQQEERDKEQDEAWQKDHPYLTWMLKAAYLLAAFSSQGNTAEALDPKYWKHIKM